MNRAGHFYYIPTQTKVKQATFDPIFDDESATFEIPMKDVQVVEEMKGDKHILRAEVYDQRPFTKEEIFIGQKSFNLLQTLNQAAITVARASEGSYYKLQPRSGNSKSTKTTPSIEKLITGKDASTDKDKNIKGKEKGKESEDLIKITGSIQIEFQEVLVSAASDGKEKEGQQTHIDALEQLAKLADEGKQPAKLRVQVMHAKNLAKADR